MLARSDGDEDQMRVEGSKMIIEMTSVLNGLNVLVIACLSTINLNNFLLE